MSATPFLVLGLLAGLAAVGLALRIAHFCRGLAWGRPQPRRTPAAAGGERP